MRSRGSGRLASSSCGSSSSRDEAAGALGARRARRRALPLERTGRRWSSPPGASGSRSRRRSGRLLGGLPRSAVALALGRARRGTPSGAPHRAGRRVRRSRVGSGSAPSARPLASSSSRIGSTATMRGDRHRARPASPLLAPRAGARVRVGDARVRERVLLELPVGRSPPAGLRARRAGAAGRPRGPETGFDERRGSRGRASTSSCTDGRPRRRPAGWDRWRRRPAALARRGDARQRGRPASDARCVTGIVLGEGRSPTRRSSARTFRAQRAHAPARGLRPERRDHGASASSSPLRLLGVGRMLGESAAIVAVLAYALAVGWQPSVVRATVAGLLASLAWLALAAPIAGMRWRSVRSCCSRGRRSRGASPASSCRSRPSPRSSRSCRGSQAALEATPISGRPAELVAVAAACGVVTAPIVLLQFGAVPTWTVPANVLAEPAMPPLVSLVACWQCSSQPVSPSAAAALAWLAGSARRGSPLVARVVGGAPRGADASGRDRGVPRGVRARGWR